MNSIGPSGRKVPWSTFRATKAFLKGAKASARSAGRVHRRPLFLSPVQRLLWAGQVRRGPELLITMGPRCAIHPLIVMTK